MTEHINIILVATDGYPEPVAHTNAIANGCSRFLNTSHTVWLITDADEPKEVWHPNVIPVKPVTNHWGWWHLMEQYRRAAPWSGGNILSMGLDTLIVDDITFVTEHPEPVYLKPFSKEFGGPERLQACHCTDGLVWIPKTANMHWLWDKFKGEVSEEKTHWFKRRFMMHPWVDEALRTVGVYPKLWQDVRPGKVVSFKRPAPKTEKPDDAAVVCFHGAPRISAAVIDYPWIGEYWNTKATR